MARTLWQNSQKKPAKMGDCARMEALGYVVLAARVEAELTAAGGGSYEQCLQRMIEVLQQEAHRQSGGTADNGRPHQ